MAIAFFMAGLSAYMFYGQGVATWCWQIATMTWIVVAYIKEKHIQKIEKQIKNENI